MFKINCRFTRSNVIVMLCIREGWEERINENKSLVQDAPVYKKHVGNLSVISSSERSSFHVYVLIVF